MNATKAQLIFFVCLIGAATAVAMSETGPEPPVNAEEAGEVDVLSDMIELGVLRWEAACYRAAFAAGKSDDDAAAACSVAKAVTDGTAHGKLEDYR